ncbi:MAG: dihydrodipicolinate reductase [Deltaproteobacteria bacterium]|nr:dihydrodipicolinate reductase [Deltaproteobacteria bacterium]
MTYRVIQWTTGNVGFHALRAIIHHPDLELMGVFAHSHEKIGRDAGGICGIDPVGVKATDDAESLLSSNADCVSYMAIGETRPRETVEDLCRILESGKNVVSTSLVSLQYPPFAHRGIRERLESACQKGGTSLYTSGIDPGFSGDTLPLTLMSLCERVDSVRVMELFNYHSYDDWEFTGEYFGFGKPPDYNAPIFFPGVLKWGWGGIVTMVADALGVELEEIREIHERAVAKETFHTTMAHVEKGTVAAVRFQVQGIVKGRPAIVAEHVNRLRDDVAPEWPSPPDGKDSCYRVVIDGSPSLKCELEIEGYDGDHNTGGVTATAMRVINAIPAVCAAPPGMLSTLDLPLVTARHLMG